MHGLRKIHVYGVASFFVSRILVFLHTMDSGLLLSHVLIDSYFRHMCSGARDMKEKSPSNELHA